MNSKINLGGRPLKYETREDLIKVIENYFDQTKFGEYSVSGLALCIGSKQLTQDYEKREGYSDIIKEAKLIVENSYELSLRKNGGTHNIFALKNFGWTDKQTTVHEIPEAATFTITYRNGDSVNESSTIQHNEPEAD